MSISIAILERTGEVKPGRISGSVPLRKKAVAGIVRFSSKGPTFSVGE
jgi:hypothetical protein